MCEPQAREQDETIEISSSCDVEFHSPGAVSIHIYWLENTKLIYQMREQAQ